MRRGMRCERCAFFHDCDRTAQGLVICTDIDECYEPSYEARREEREAYEVDKADAKRKGYD